MRELISLDRFTGGSVGRMERRKKKKETKPSLATRFPTSTSMQAEGTQQCEQPFQPTLILAWSNHRNTA